MISESRIFNISSQSGTKNNASKNSNIDYYLPNFVNNQNDDEILAVYLSIKNAEIPLSFYLVNEYNNIISINNVLYTLTQGNYNVKTFIIALKALLGVNFTISYNSITYKITITSLTTFTINYLKTTMEQFLGISSTNDTTAILINGLYTITSPYVVNFLPLQKIHLRSNIPFDNFNNFDKSNDILLSIQNNSNNLAGVVLYNNDTNLKYLVNEKDVSNFTLRITDNKNRELDLNNIDWFLTFTIEYIYKTIPVKNNLSRLLKNNSLNFIKQYIESLEQEEQ